MRHNPGRLCGKHNDSVSSHGNTRQVGHALLFALYNDDNDSFLIVIPNSKDLYLKFHVWHHKSHHLEAIRLPDIEVVSYLSHW